MSNRGSIMSEEERVELLNWVNSTIMPNIIKHPFDKTKFSFYDLTTNMVPATMTTTIPGQTVISVTSSLDTNNPKPASTKPDSTIPMQLVSADYPIHPLISVIRQRIMDKEGLTDSTSNEENASFHDFIGIVSPGGYLHKHSDINKDTLFQSRFNVFLQVSQKSGDTYYGDALADPVEGCYVFCPCGLYEHWSKPNTDTKNRINISFAFLLPKDQVLSLIK